MTRACLEMPGREIRTRVGTIGEGPFVSLTVDTLILDLGGAGPTHLAKWRKVAASILAACDEAESKL